MDTHIISFLAGCLLGGTIGAMAVALVASGNRRS